MQPRNGTKITGRRLDTMIPFIENIDGGYVSALKLQKIYIDMDLRDGSNPAAIIGAYSKKEDDLDILVKLSTLEQANQALAVLLSSLQHLPFIKTGIGEYISAAKIMRLEIADEDEFFSVRAVYSKDPEDFDIIDTTETRDQAYGILKKIIHGAGSPQEHRIDIVSRMPGPRSLN